MNDGTICRSGPNCNRHGGKTTTEAPTNKPQGFSMPTAYEIALQAIDIELIAGLSKVEDHICARSVSVDQLEDLGDNSLLEGLSARECDKHNMYHVYEKRNMAKVLETIGFSFHSLVRSEFKSGRITREEEKALHLLVNKKQVGVAETFAQEDDTLMQNYLESIRGTEIEAKAREIAAGPLKQSRLQVFSPPKALVKHGPAKIHESKVSDAHMLEYWQCGRKMRHNTKESAARILKEDMSAYACSYCHGFHKGHGKGERSTDSQIKSARKHWTENSPLANRFAAKRGLLKK